MPLHHDEGETCLQMGTRSKKKENQEEKGLMKEDSDR